MPKGNAIDHDDVVWLGTDGGGLVELDGNNWTIYNKFNSSLPSKAIFSIYVDDENNKWVTATRGGIYVFGPIK